MPMQVSVFDFELNARNRLRRFLAFNSKSKTETCIVSMQMILIYITKNRLGIIPSLPESQLRRSEA
jgi:hypothetical protein